MYSTSEHAAPAVRKKTEETERIIIRRRTNGASLEYVGDDPDTRYLPREENRVSQALHWLWLGFFGRTGR